MGEPAQRMGHYASDGAHGGRATMWSGVAVEGWHRVGDSLALSGLLGDRR